VKEILKKGPSKATINNKDDIGFTPIMTACSSGQLEAAKEIHKSGGDVDIKLEDGTTCLYMAS